MYPEGGMFFQKHFTSHAIGSGLAASAAAETAATVTAYVQRLTTGFAMAELAVSAV
jgi:hypothetical protein